MSGLQGLDLGLLRLRRPQGRAPASERARESRRRPSHRPGAQELEAALWIATCDRPARQRGHPGQPQGVEAEMARQGLRGRSSRRKMRTTRRDLSKVAALDLVGRDFERAKLDQLWIGDATYIWTDEGWLYLATVIDACSRRLLGWSITDHLRTELCLDAIEAAVATRGGRQRLVRGVVFHTDHGTQYTADAFTKACRSFRITQSMGTVGDSYDNAMAESFFSSFKREVVDGEHFATRAEARAEIFAWLNWYNTIRLHSSLDFCPPIEYEEHLAEQSLVA